MISPQLTLGNDFAQTLAKWGAELRNYKFTTSDDFELSKFDITSVTGNGTLTYTAITTNFCQILKYKPLKIALIAFETTGTTAGAGATLYFAKMPVSKAAGGFFMGATNLVDNGAPISGFSVMYTDANYIAVTRYDGALFGVGTGRSVNVGVILNYA